MSVQREELHELVEQLPEDQVPDALVLLRARRPGAGSWPPAWFGAAAGTRADVGECADEILRDELGR